MVRRYPRYGQLYDQWQAQAWGPWSAHDYRDLQVLSQLAWFDEVFLTADAEVRELVSKGRDYTLADQALMGRKQLDEFPEIHQTFNLVPSMVEQIEDYAANTASDPFLRLALKPAEQLSFD